MNWIVSVLIVCFLLFQLDMLLTLLYAKLRRRRYIVQQGNKADQLGDKVARKSANKSAESLYLKVGRYYDGWVRYKLIRLGNVPCHAYRNFILRHVYHMQLEKHVVIYGGFEIRAPWNISIGEGTIIGDEAKLDGRREIIIGKNVNFSTGVWVWTLQHDLDDPWFSTKNKGGAVHIEDRAWISGRAVILPNVHIHTGAVVATGAVITKNCEAYGVYGGVPGKLIRKRNTGLLYEFSGKCLPFF